MSVLVGTSRCCHACLTALAITCVSRGVPMNESLTKIIGGICSLRALLFRQACQSEDLDGRKKSDRPRKPPQKSIGG